MSRSMFATLTLLLCATGCGGQALSFPDDATRQLADAASKHDYAKVQELLATPDGHPADPAMIGDLLSNSWNDDGKAASAVFQWAVKPNGPKEERAAALAAHAVAECLATCDDKYFHNQGGRRAFAQANPFISRVIAQVLARHIPAAFGDNKADREFENLDNWDPYHSNAGLLLVALLGEPQSAEIMQKAVDDAVDVWIDRYARSVREQPSDRDVAALLKSAGARGVFRRAQRANHLPEDAHGYFDEVGVQLSVLRDLQSESGSVPGDITALVTGGLIDLNSRQVILNDQIHKSVESISASLTKYWLDNKLDSVHQDFQDAVSRYQVAARP